MARKPVLFRFWIFSSGSSKKKNQTQICSGSCRLGDWQSYWNWVAILRNIQNLNQEFGAVKCQNAHVTAQWVIKCHALTEQKKIKWTYTGPGSWLAGYPPHHHHPGQNLSPTKNHYTPFLTKQNQRYGSSSAQNKTEKTWGFPLSLEDSHRAKTHHSTHLSWPVPTAQIGDFHLKWISIRWSVTKGRYMKIQLPSGQLT